MTMARTKAERCPWGRGRRRDFCLKAVRPALGESRQAGGSQPLGCPVSASTVGPTGVWAIGELTFGPRCSVEGKGKQGMSSGKSLL